MNGARRQTMERGPYTLAMVRVCFLIGMLSLCACGDTREEVEALKDRLAAQKRSHARELLDANRRNEEEIYRLRTLLVECSQDLGAFSQEAAPAAPDQDALAREREALKREREELAILREGINLDQTVALEARLSQLEADDARYFPAASNATIGADLDAGTFEARYEVLRKYYNELRTAYYDLLDRTKDCLGAVSATDPNAPGAGLE